MFFNIRNQNSRKQVCSDDFAVRFAFLLPAIALAVIIFLFSAQPSDDSTETSQFVTRLILNIYDAAKGEKPAYAELMRLVAVYEPIVRECAHFTEYAVFGFFLAFGLAHNGIRGRRCLFFPILIACCYSLSDEIHQLFVPGRTFQLIDICADSAGGACGSLVYWLFHWKKFHRGKKGKDTDHGMPAPWIAAISFLLCALLTVPLHAASNSTGGSSETADGSAAAPNASYITVTFDANGGTGSMDALTESAGSKFTLPACTYERFGYIFRGWVTTPGIDALGNTFSDSSAGTSDSNTENSGSGASGSGSGAGNSVSSSGDTGSEDKTVAAEYTDQSSVSFDSSKTLYALWEPQLYVIHFDGNGIYNKNVTDMYAYYNTPAALDKNRFYREDYWFRGWFDHQTGRSFDDGEVVTSLKTGDTASTKTLTVDNGKPENDKYTFRSTQGSCVYTKDGTTYLVSASIINDGAYNKGDLSHYENILVKYDLSTGKVVKSVRNLPFDHANSICYCEDNGHLYVAEGGQCEGYPSGVMELDEGLNEIREWNFPLLSHIWAISWSSGYFYVIGKGNDSRNSLCVLNEEMKTLSITAVDDYYENYSSQGIASDGTFIYAVSAGFRDYNWKNRQRISVFTHEGEYLGVFSIDLSDEIEDISLDGDYMYLTTNEHSGTTVYRARIPSVTLSAIWSRN